jgi:hypothetical protein
MTKEKDADASGGKRGPGKKKERGGLRRELNQERREHMRRGHADKPFTVSSHLPSPSSASTITLP